MENVLAVGLGEIQSSANAGDVLVAYGLGSCVGISVYDPVIHGGVMAHVMLPESVASNGAAKSAKFATEAVPLVMETLKGMGGIQSRWIWKIAGGAQVLSVPGLNGRMLIGERNVATIKDVMKKLGLVVRAEDTGGRCGRTMQLFVDSGRVTIRSVGGQQRDL